MRKLITLMAATIAMAGCATQQIPVRQATVIQSQLTSITKIKPTLLGAVAGGAAGYAIGKQIGKGDGNKVAKVTGAILGTTVGATALGDKVNVPASVIVMRDSSTGEQLSAVFEGDHPVGSTVNFYILNDQILQYQPPQ